MRQSPHLWNSHMSRKIAWIIMVAAVAFVATMRGGSAQIVALGASATAGYGLAPSESFPSQLQAMLQAKGSSTRVINAGVSGETTVRSLRASTARCLKARESSF